MSVFSCFQENLPLSHDLKQIGHRIHFAGIDNVPTKTLVAFVATGGSLRIGFAYRFHSTLVIYYDDDPFSDMTNRPLKRSFPPVSTVFLVFDETTSSEYGDKLTSDDMEFEWFTQDVVELIKSELGAQQGIWRNCLDNVIDSLHNLPAEGLLKVLKYVSMGMPEFDLKLYGIEPSDIVDNTTTCSYS